jgi:hypothetical protein
MILTFNRKCKKIVIDLLKKSINIRGRHLIVSSVYNPFFSLYYRSLVLLFSSFLLDVEPTRAFSLRRQQWATSDISLSAAPTINPQFYSINMTKALCLIILLALSTISLINCHAAHDKVSSVHPLPSKVLMGYASSNYTNVINAVTDDLVNVVIWAFADIRVDELAPFTATHRDLSLNSAAIVTNLNLTAVKSTIEHLNDNGYSIHHLVSVGGWNGHHLDSQISASLWMDTWQSSELSDIFHGIDWDLEGSDDLTSEENVFTVDCLDKMGEISRLMKQGEFMIKRLLSVQCHIFLVLNNIMFTLASQKPAILSQ